MNTRNDPCPPLEDLSALFDGQAGRRTRRLQQHVGACPRCASALAGFGALRQRLQPLRMRAPDLGIAEAVLLRLPRERPRAARSRRAWAWAPQHGWRALGGVAALAAGLTLGLTLVAGGAVADRTGMSVFDAEPAGRLCAGLPACAPRRR